MLHATSHCHHDSRLPVGTITLDHRGRHLRRKRLITDQGDIIMIDLPEAVLLADGDALVLKDGRIEEMGSHEHLLAAGGLYAELFNLQAEGYR